MNQNEAAYLKGGITPLATDSSILISSSKYLNSAAMRTLVAISCGLIRSTLHYPRTMPLMLDAMALSRRLARKLRTPLFSVRWEDYFHSSITAIREELNIRDAPADGEWAWAYEEMRGSG